MNRFTPLLAGAAIALAGGTFAYAQSGAQPSITMIQEVASDGAESSEVVEMVMGAEDAPITIIEYASFTCSHCATFHENTLSQLKTDYVDTGKVKFIFREVYFDRFGLWASMVARCGGEERFFGMADILMKTQAEWTRGGDPVAISDSLRKTGRMAGLGDDQIQACLQNEDSAKALVSWYQENASADGIEATPTLIIDGEKHSNMSYSDLRKILDAKL